MESRRKIVGKFQEEIQRRHLLGEAQEHYIKTCRGRLAVQVIDPFTGEETTRILKGDVTDPDVDKEDYRLALYTELDAQHFKQTNRALIERGLLVPDTPEVRESQLVNVITDEEIEEVLRKPFFALKSKLDKFTSPVPVERFLRTAIGMNKAIGTVQVIEKRLAELQQAEYSVAEPETTFEV